MTSRDTSTVQIDSLAVDATDPHRLARFWAPALRWTTSETDGGGVELVPTPADPATFRLLFRRARTDKIGQNRIHFDLTTTSLDDQDDTVADLVAIGARHIDIGQAPDDTHVVLADPEGNEFCVIEPGNQFLASCPRLGAVNCDGTRALGTFFSDAVAWPLVWDENEETAIQAPDGTGPKVTWSGPPLLPKPPKDRFHFHLGPAPGTSAQAALDHLLRLGATRSDIDPACPGAVALTDVDGNAVCLVER